MKNFFFGAFIGFGLLVLPMLISGNFGFYLLSDLLGDSINLGFFPNIFLSLILHLALTFVIYLISRTFLRFMDRKIFSKGMLYFFFGFISVLLACLVVGYIAIINMKIEIL